MREATNLFVFAIVMPLLIVLQFGCARAPIKSHLEALRVVKNSPKIEDQWSLETLSLGIEENVEYLLSRPEDQMMEFGPYNIKAVDYGRALQPLLEILRNKDLDEATKRSQLIQHLQDNFEVLEVYGTEEWGQIFMTAYFEPLIEGRKQPEEPFTRPLYRTPSDLVTVDYEGFLDIYPQYRPPGILLTEQKSAKSVLRGRLVSKLVNEKKSTKTKPAAKSESAQPLHQVVPYYSREEIDQKNALKGKDLEIMYVDPIDSFFLQIQGSGIVKFENGETIQVGYASQNGHPYVPIGRFLFDVIPKEEMSLQTIEAHLRTLNEEELHEILNKNPSYVFFQELQSRSITSMGTPTVPGRTIATDRRFFPKGAFGYLMHDMPVFDGSSDQPSEWQATSRFVIDQDTGGAIRGPGRLDLYLGAGGEARKQAGVMKRGGKLYYFFPKALIGRAQAAQ